jgi:amino acid transporter
MAAAPHEYEKLEYEGGGLAAETNWWGAFVIGLAGTILVTGIAPVMVTSLGAASVPLFVGVTLSGVLLILLLAELSAMMPERAGGSPSYAYPAWKVRYPRLAPHINGFTAWAYWMGWFPVAPLNMILASYYLADLLGLNTTSGFTPITTFVAWSTFVIAFGGILLLFIPSYLGIRFGAVFATVLAMLAMIPLTFLAIAWIFNPGVADWSQLAGFHNLSGGSFFAAIIQPFGHNWFYVYTAFTFLLSWNVIAFEAAACYIGECRNPERDGKITMILSGGYGLFIYTLIPVAFVVVLGAKALSDPALVDPKTMFIKFAGDALGGALGSAMNWIVAIMLIVALLLSALNAIMGSARGLHQMSVDGQFPRWFSHVNRHGVPDRAMLVNTAASLVVVCLGGAVQIYSFSNVGYIASFVPVIIGYYLLRKYKPNVRRPFKLPEFFKYLALALAGLYVFFWIGGGVTYSIMGNVTVYYILGWVTLLAYLPLYWWRHKVEDPKYAKQAEGELIGTLTPGADA